LTTTTTTTTLTERLRISRDQYLVVSLRRLWRSPRAKIGLCFIAVIAFLSLAAPVISPFGPNTLDINERLLPPLSGLHIFGTDDIGRDILTRTMWAGRVSLSIAVVSVAFALLIGLPLGLIAGYRGKLTDEGISRFVDVMLAFPPILMALVIVTLLGPGIVNLGLAIGIAYFPGMVRIIRGGVLVEKQKLYVEASKAKGESSFYIITSHILPNIQGPLLVQVTLNLSTAMLYEAFLSFVGLGVQSPTASWGSMISQGQGFLQSSPWIAIFPGIFLSIAVLGFNLLGDGMRDAFDPRLLEGRGSK
jgi:peptide/nickel transport system permease protein